MFLRNCNKKSPFCIIILPKFNTERTVILNHVRCFLKQSNLDFDKSSFCHKKDYIFVNAYFIPENEKCPVCDSDSLYKNGHTYKTVKHCVYRTNLILVRYIIYLEKMKSLIHL